jgi:hypothetical protein
MILKNNEIINSDEWKRIAPPMGGDKQWKPGRSAMELADYMTKNLPDMPQAIEDVLMPFTSGTAEFDWSAEYITNLTPFGLGRGEGRNHDAFLWNPDVVVGIEGKVDEPLGSEYIRDAMKSKSPNKLHRVQGMVEMLFGGKPEAHGAIRYQLVTASIATLLEATKRGVKNAVLLVIVFKKPGYYIENCIEKTYYSEKNIRKNNEDIEVFLKETRSTEQNGMYLIPTAYGKETGINLYFKKIEIIP